MFIKDSEGGNLWNLFYVKKCGKSTINIVSEKGL